MTKEQFNGPSHRLTQLSARRFFRGCLPLIAVILIFALAGCATKPKPAPPGAPEVVSLKKLSPSGYPHFGDDLDFDNLERAISQSIAYLQGQPAQREYVFGPDRISAGHVLKSLQRFQSFIIDRPTAGRLQDFIRDHYLVYQSVGRNAQDEVLFTGYYEPILRGSRSRKPEYAYPVYPRPEDLITVDLGAFSEKFKGEKIVGRVSDRALVPYYERREIEEEGVLYGKVQPIAWVNDPVDLFFLHIQGSGKIALDDGQMINVHYDGSNGRPYRSIGQLLIDEGKIPREEMSMQRIRAYLRDNPLEIQHVLDFNPSFIFFTIAPGGALGALNVRLTPGRSLALDRKIFPPAVLTFIETKKPLSEASGKVQSWVDCRRFMLNQDTGGAIVGPGRADIFWGEGPYAELAAGYLKHPGKLYFLVLKPEAGAP
jgi:peptidoglycan lytic transglycosylase A